MAHNECPCQHVADELGRGWMLFGLGILALINVIVYRYQLQETNSNAGFEPITWNTPYLMRLVIGLAFVSTLIPTGLRRPSDVFQLLYGLFVPISYALFHEIGGPISTVSFASRLAMLCIPMIVVWLIAHIEFKLPQFGLLTQENLIVGLVATCGLVAVTVILHGPLTSGFSLEETYVRRLEGRETFPTGSVMAYASMMTANSLAPFLAFISAIAGYRWLFAYAIAVGICFFFSIGLKAPVAYIALAYLFGIGLKHQRASMFHKAIFWLFCLTFALFVAEYLFADGYSLIAAETIYRRTFAVPADVLTHYFDLMFGSNASLWSPWSGVVPDTPEGVTYLVGNIYYASDAANVNTNAFVVALAGSGVLTYLVTLTLAASVFLVLNAFHAEMGDDLCMFIAFIYSILLTEQAAPTVLASSGVGILLLLVMVSEGKLPDSKWPQKPLPKQGSIAKLNVNESSQLS